MSSRVFAVDLGAWSVKLAIASPGLRGATLLDVVERPVPPGEESAELRARAVLAQMISELRLGHDTGYIGVYGDQVFTQVIEFGFKNLRRAELEKAVGGELEGVTPVDLEDMVYTFEPLPQVPLAAPPIGGDVARGRVAPVTDGMRVLTYAMHRERAEEMISLGKQAGFEVRGVLACGGAAVRLVERTPSLVRARAEGAVAVVDIGHERTDVVVVAQGKAVFSRSIARGGKQVTEAIADEFKSQLTSFTDAERAKHSDGFVASTAEPATSASWARIHGATIRELQPLARDLRQTLASCRARTGFTPTAVLLVGGGSRLRGMSSFMSEQLGIPAWRPSAEDSVALAGPRKGAEAASLPIDSAALTIGMVYDAAGGRPLFDLRSGQLAHKVDLSFLRAKAVPLGAAALAVAAFAAVSAYADLYRLRKAEKVLSERLAIETKDDKLKTVDEILAANSGAPGGGAAALPKSSAYDILLEISQKVPGKDKIQLDIDEIEITDNKIDVVGYVKTSAQVDLLVAELKSIKCFKEVTRGPQETEGELKKFKLTITAPCM